MATAQSSKDGDVSDYARMGYSGTFYNRIRGEIRLNKSQRLIV